MKRKIVIVLSFFTILLTACQKNPPVNSTPQPPIETEPRIIYVSPNGSGDVATKESPTDFSTAAIIVNPGDTILLEAGTYKFRSRINLYQKGTPEKRIMLKPEIDGSKVILDFSSQEFLSTNRGIQLSGNYWNIYGIDVTGAGDNGLYICGNYNTIENCQFYKNRDSGLQLGRGASSQTTVDLWPSNNLIRNCTSFNNYDDETLGENADGFAAKLTVGYGNVFDGCIAFRNSDDGWDLYGKEDSGNIGHVILYNCVSFENGFLPESHESNLGTPTFNTTNGDGIGFKLGGSSMEGDVIVNNCVAFNNKLHGFGDNSNPGFIQMTNCTSFNNCIGLNEDGSVSNVRGILGEENNSNNFDMARDTNSYNSYYGLLSYINNQINYSGVTYNEDAFRGSTAYSIFQTSYNTEQKKEDYLVVHDYLDASSYTSDTLTRPTEMYEISDDCFASLDPVNAIYDKAYEIHSLFRNDDMSINLGDLLRLVDEKLLTFAEGKPIGAVLNKSSMAEYEHPTFTDVKNNISSDEIAVHHAWDVLDVLTNKDAVYQDFELPAYINGCEVVWESLSPDLITIDNVEKFSNSAAAYVYARLTSTKTSAKASLKATVYYGQASKEKQFEVTVMPRNHKLGKLISDKEETSYIVGRYQNFNKPNILVTDASSISETELDKSLYDLVVTYEYALERGGNYVEVNDIYTSVPGVFKVTTKAVSKIVGEEGKTLSYEYYVFIGDDKCEIDFNGGIHNFTLNSGGFNITATLTNITGRIYVAVVDNDVTMFDASEVINYENVQVYNIYSDKLNTNFIANNSLKDGYKVYYVISDRVNENYSSVYCKIITTKTISTQQEFYNLAQGIVTSEKNVIYNLTNNLDFKDFVWKDATKPDQFVGTFNGNGYTISNININTAIPKQANIFYKVTDGTIFNVNFENISIVNTASSAKLVGIVGAMNGGYISNINIKNITSKAVGQASGSVGGLVGQIINGNNFIDYITLVNDENQEISCTNKYVAGIVGNIQLDSNMPQAAVYISYCVVKSDIGHGKDTSGCVAGIVGRIKNDSETYYLNISNCYYKGTIKAKGNYNAGILGSVESGVGKWTVNNNFADVVFIYGAEALVLDAKTIYIPEEEAYQEYAHKNCNPICGRANSLTGEIVGEDNLGSWKEYYSTLVLSESIYFMYGQDFIPNENVYRSGCGWDMEKWIVLDDGTVSLK